VRRRLAATISLIAAFMLLVTATPVNSYGQTPGATSTATATAQTTYTASPQATTSTTSTTTTFTATPTPTGTVTGTATPSGTQAPAVEPTAVPEVGEHFFPETGFTVPAVFMKFWTAKGGLPIFGYPISEARTEVNPSDKQQYLVQYFERNRFEYHPENDADNEVLLGLLGAELTSQRTFEPGQPFENSSDRVFFPETQHSLSEPFLSYWRSYGGLAVFGYPISEPAEEKSFTDGKTYVVQYFQRNRFEYHPENVSPYDVLLGLLGRDALDIQDTLTAWGTPTTDSLPVERPLWPPAKPAIGGTFLQSEHVGDGLNVQLYYQDHERLLNMVNDLNFGWITQQVEWKETEIPKGVFYWGELDRIVNSALQHNVKVLLSVVKAPSWATGGFNGFPKDPIDIYDFMKAMADHFKGRVQAYMIYNEQNLTGESGDVNPGRYVEVLKQAYLGVKASDPSAIVLTGALAPTGINDPLGERGAGEMGVLSDLRYLEEMYKYNNGEVRRYFDVLGTHPYGFNNPPETKYPDNPNMNPDFPFNASLGKRDWYNLSNSFYFRRIEEQRAIMEKYGDGRKQMWVTEYGWCSDYRPDGYGECKYNTPQQQGEYLVRAMDFAKKYYPWMGPMFIWNLNFSTFQQWYTGPSHFSIINGDWTARPAYFALKSRGNN
jgi:hypothetical protein